MTRLRRSTLLAVGLVMIVMSVLSVSQSAWIYSKAVLAQYLLEIAWNESRGSSQAKKPWPWADVHTVARLAIPTVDRSFIVLSDASGEAMAFGPGLVGGNPLAASTNTIAIGGHRDTHLQFLEYLPIGADITIESLDQQYFRYQVIDKQIVDTRRQTLSISKYSPGLVLITCFPFNATQSGGHLRMVARAILMDA